MATTEKIAKLVYDFKYEDLPTKAIEMAKYAVIDSLGVGVLGYDQPVTQAVAKLMADNKGGEQARVWKTGESMNQRSATIINSVAMHCMDYDNGGSLGHPAAVFLPPVIAIGEKLKISGKQLMEAYAIAYELGAQLRNSMGDLQFRAGYHATSLLGCICSAAACAKVMGLDVQGIRMAMAIACSLSSGMLISFGTDAKPVQVGRAAENGLLAAQLAAEGCCGEPDIFEVDKGFYYVYAEEEGSIKGLTNNFGKLLALANERPHLKQWACCGGNYEILSLLYDLLPTQPIDVNEIKSITISTSMTPPGPAFRVKPRTAMEGRFSITYNAASCLVDHYVDLSTFTKEKFDRPIIHELINKMEVVWHPECAGKPKKLQGESRFVTIDIYMNDGTVISKRQDAAQRKHLEFSQVYTKFADNCRSVGLAEEKIEKVSALVKDLENVEDINEIIGLLY